MGTSLEAALPAARAAADVREARRAALWGLLAAKLVGSWGLGWDIRWHLLIGRESFWIPPHLLTYAAVAAGALLAAGVLARETWRARSGEPVPGAVRLLGLTGTPGFHLAAAGMALTITAAPFDEAWHRAFGLDVTLWSPPHLLGLAGAQVNTLGCLVIACELWPPAHPARRVAVLAGGAFLLGAFEILADPALRLAFLHGGPAFFLWSILGGLGFTFALALGARLEGSRAAPLLLAAGAVLVQLAMFLVADLGFALLRPVPVIAQAIAADPTSPVAVAHEMARRNGAAEPGRSLALRLLPVVPAALAALADLRRRWAAGTLVFGAALLAVSTVHFLRAPALAHAWPAPAHAVPGALLTLTAALTGGAAARALAAWTSSRRSP